MSSEEKPKIIKELEEKIRMLEAENELLTERGEDTLLLSLVSEQINNLVDHDEIMDIALEQISVLKGLCFCASATIEKNICLVNRSFCTKVSTGFDGTAIELTKNLAGKLMEGPVLIDCNTSGPQGVKIPVLLSEIGVQGILLIPCFGRIFPDKLFVFADDLSAGSLEENRNLLQRAVEMLADRLDNLALLEKISALNQELDRKVEERTAALKRSEALYRTLVENIDMGVTLIDNEHNVIMANAAQGKMFGRPPESFVGKKCFREFEKRDNECEHCPGKKSLKSGLAEEAITSGEKENGEKFTVRIKAFPIIEADKKPRGFIEVVEDVSEKIQIEDEVQQARKVEAMGVLAGGIAHDFNNLLTAIMGNISLAKLYSSPSDKVHAKLDEMEKASVRARDLTEQLLTFAKGGSPAKKTISVKELISDAATFTLRGSNVKCLFDFPEDLWLADVDPGQLGQVIQNLVINASQAMPSGGLIHLGGENLDHKSGDPYLLATGKYIKIAVRDEGEGIEANLLNSIFDPYFTTKTDGTGIGLATSYSIIKNHGGMLTVESEPGEGSVFYIYLPVSNNKNKPENEGGKDSKERQVKVPKGRGRVLVMDDEDIVLEVAGEMLAYAGYQVEVSCNGQEAVEKYRQALKEKKPFDVVILDLTVPGEGWGGNETFQKLKEIDADVKAIVSSGYANNKSLVNYREHGFAGRISKPYRIERLSNTLREVLGGSVD